VAEIGFQVGLGIFLLGYISKYIKNCETSARLVVMFSCQQQSTNRKRPTYNAFTFHWAKIADMLVTLFFCSTLQIN